MTTKIMIQKKNMSEEDIDTPLLCAIFRWAEQDSNLHCPFPDVCFTDRYHSQMVPDPWRPNRESNPTRRRYEGQRFSEAGPLPPFYFERIYGGDQVHTASALPWRVTTLRLLSA